MPRGRTAPPQRSKKTGRRTISGRGDYATVAAVSGLAKKLDTVLKKAPKGSFASRGSNIGASIGRALGSGLSAITGYGDYTVRGNSIGTVSTSSDMVPEFVAKREGDHSTRIRHREYLMDLKVPTDPLEFNNNFVENINPGNPVLFPWLAKMSKLYTQYKIHGMVLVYKTMSSNYSAGGGPLGTVIIAANYNVNDKKFESKVQMENSEFAVSTDPSRNIVHAIECDPKVSGLQTLYIRDPNANDPLALGDPRFFDFAKVQIATTGLPGQPGTVMGEIWCSYDIELIKPVVGYDTDPSPITTTQGVVLTSQSDGSQSVSQSAKRLSAQVSETQVKPTVNTTGTELTPSPVGSDYSGDPIFLNQSGNTIPVVQLTAGDSVVKPTLRFFRNGTYTVRTMAKFRGTSSSTSTVGTGPYGSNLYEPLITTAGVGPAGTFRGFTAVDIIPHVSHTQPPADGVLPGTLTTLYNYGVFQTSFSITVAGLPLYDVDKYVSVNLPNIAQFDTGNNVRVIDKTLHVEWSGTETKPVVTSGIPSS